MDGFQCYVMLRKDAKIICRVRCSEPSIAINGIWDINEIIKQVYLPTGLSSTHIQPVSENMYQKEEWHTFMRFLKQYKKISGV